MKRSVIQLLHLFEGGKPARDKRDQEGVNGAGWAGVLGSL